MLRHAIIMSAALGAASFAAQVSANFINDTIYTNGDPDFIEAGVSDPTFSFQFADDFSRYGNDYIVQDVHWYGAYWEDRAQSGFTTPTEPDDFTIRFFEDNNGLPGSEFLSLNVGEVERYAVPDEDFYSYWVAIDDLELMGNTIYWLSILNNTSTQDNFWGFATVNYPFDSAGNAAERQTNGDDWAAVEGVELSFSLTGTVIPEPTTLALLSLGLAGLGFTRRRMKA